MKGIVVGCDDGRVRKLGSGLTVYACVAYEGLRPMGVHMGLLRVDGLEASSLIAYSSLAASGTRPRVLLLDSLTIAGFNVVSPATIERMLGAGVIAVYKYRPSYERLEKAFNRLPYSMLRSRILRLIDRARPIETRWGPAYIVAWGIPWEDAVGVVRRYQLHSRTPEPVRVAHEVASEASRLLG